MTDPLKTSGSRQGRGNIGVFIPAPLPTFNIVAKRNENSLFFPQSWICDKPYFVTIDTGAFLTCQVIRRSKMARKEAKSTLHPAYDIKGTRPIL
jgi:hypothetical protein